MNLSIEPISSTSPPPTFAPVAKADRLVNLDFVRGMALLGILLVNVAVMLGPLAAISQPTYLAQYTGADRVAILLVLTFCQTKFVSTFSLLFGYGLLGQIERAAAAGRSPAGFTFRRLGVLALFGAIHALFIWYGDVLFVYACLGCWLLLARGVSARTLLIIAACILSFTLVLRCGLEALTALAPTTSPPVQLPPNAPPIFQQLAKGGFNPASEQWIEAETTAFRDGPWIHAQFFRAFGWFANLVASLMYLGWLALGMFFLGGALWRVKFFSPEQRELRWKVLRICLPLGLLFEAVAAGLFWTYPPSQVWPWALGHVIQQVGLFFLPLGYVAGFALLAESLPDALRNPVASAGKMSLTVYLLESVVMTGLASHWGFRLFGLYGPAMQTALAVAVWLGLVLFAHLWLMVFRRGPMEWLWRRLGYGRAATSSAD